MGYSYSNQAKAIEVGASFLYSIESDYTSYGSSLWANWHDKIRLNELSFSLQLFFDDLRWGSLNPGYLKPTKLIYPQELRATKWFDNYQRNSYNFSMTYSRVLAKRLNMAFVVGFSCQSGLLSTPFHRVYFNDGITEKVENLPTKRFKFPISVSVNYFAGTQFIWRNQYRFYTDNFGVTANTISSELAIKCNSAITLSPGVRLYQQLASRYFQAYAEHAVDAPYYTSDYDLSRFHSWQPSLGFRWAPFKLLNKHGFLFQELQLRYAYYWRSDGLQAHTISSFFEFRK